jgi:superfamily I DNA/RNA helicase
MNWWQALIVALSTLIVTKLIDLLVSKFTEKRDFNKFRREKISDEIEALKNEIGKLFELAENWKSFEEKQRSYLTNFQNDHELVGRSNKYPSIAQTARDTVHWCRIVASCEMRQTDDLIENKKELGTKFKKFLTACDDYMNSLV